MRTSKDIKNNTLQNNPPFQDIEYDKNGLPVGYTVEEIFDRIDQKLIDHYGENIRKMVNQSRSEWDKKYPWKFKNL